MTTGKTQSAVDGHPTFNGVFLNSLHFSECSFQVFQQHLTDNNFIAVDLNHRSTAVFDPDFDQDIRFRCEWPGGKQVNSVGVGRRYKENVCSIVDSRAQCLRTGVERWKNNATCILVHSTQFTCKYCQMNSKAGVLKDSVADNVDRVRIWECNGRLEVWLGHDLPWHLSLNRHTDDNTGKQQQSTLCAPLLSL